MAEPVRKAGAKTKARLSSSEASQLSRDCGAKMAYAERVNDGVNVTPAKATACWIMA